MLLGPGQIVAVKGLGGYHLAADAACEEAVAALRARKHREDKPFAIMAADLAAARRLCQVDDAEADLLASPARPIVLLARLPDAPVAASVAPGNRQLGIMLPYTPLHHLLLAAVGRPVVLTSGNVSDEPIAYRDEDALDQLGGIADAFLTHDRADPHQDRRLGGPRRPRPPDADQALTRLRAGTRHGARCLFRLPPPGARLRRGAEEHVLPGERPARLRLAPHRRPGERGNPPLLHRGHRALQPPLRHHPAGRGLRPAPGVPVDEVRARPRRRRPRRRAAPPRAHRVLPGRQRRGRPGHRRRVRRHRLRHRRHDLGRRVPDRDPGELPARRPPDPGARCRAVRPRSASRGAWRPATSPRPA